ARRPARRGKVPQLPVEVVWGDITQTGGDIYCAGHYRGVLPQRAERALDTVISFNRNEPEDLSRCVLRNLTRRGGLRGELGDVRLFPWADKRDRGKSVAIAGMGFPGSFTLEGLEQLAANLAWQVGDLPGDKTICTVLIGSGEGGLSVRESVAGLVRGMTRAVREGLRGNVRLLRIVEKSYSRAQRIRQELLALAKADAQGLQFRVAAQLKRSPGGDVAYALTTRRAPSGGKPASLQPLLQLAGSRAGKARVRQALESLVPGPLAVDGLAVELQLATLEDEDRWRSFPSRISFVRRDRGVRVAAINDTAVVPERDLDIDFVLIEELSERTTDPAVAELPALARSLNRRLVPADFRDHVALPSTKIFEVDRDTAIVHWELMALPTAGYLGLSYPVARQLRTGYSGKPESASRPAGPLRALVIGDPGDPEQQEDLPGAREEARRVASILRDCGVETNTRIGAPTRRSVRWGREGGPATRLEVLSLLDGEPFDILHYSGHGDFDPEDPRRTGWVFKDGLLTAGDIETVGSAPRLVVANACLSSRTSRVQRGSIRVDTAASDAGLLPSLADEFLRRGVRNYVGTAWEVSDEGAILFAEVVYGQLLGAARATLGQALLEARLALAAKDEAYGALWLAYQHYGDPDLRLTARPEE
ncbi:MAG TPA: CHAT domain-containing protein, partial [Candidatus Polarisedimenticolaceae bacterium]|nr:CHAT domain-containing protein [Candidatus Polarisedimenticolaceae bacterium]